MNYNEDWGNRGANIIPAARPSIHNHEGCIFVAPTSSMVRYGIDEGVDVVDNAHSKPSEPISPAMYTKFKKSPIIQNSLRRNSLNNENGIYTDDGERLLSQSAPATLPSQLRYSDDSDEEQTSAQNVRVNESYNSSNRTPNVNRTPVTDRNHRTSNVTLANEILARESAVATSIIKPTLCLVSMVVFCTSAFVMKLKNDEYNKEVYDERMFSNDIIDVGQKYNVDENNLLKVQTGISTIFKREDVGAFMFVYNSGSQNFDKRAFNIFMNELSYTSSKYLRNDTKPLQYIVIEGKDLTMREHSDLMCKFRDDLHKTGLMLVKDIEAIPSRLAMAFHYICDEYNPLVKKSAVFFTIDLAKCPTKGGENALRRFGFMWGQNWGLLVPKNIGPRIGPIFLGMIGFEMLRHVMWNKSAMSAQ